MNGALLGRCGQCKQKQQEKCLYSVLSGHLILFRGAAWSAVLRGPRCCCGAGFRFHRASAAAPFPSAKLEISAVRCSEPHTLPFHVITKTAATVPISGFKFQVRAKDGINAITHQRERRPAALSASGYSRLEAKCYNPVPQCSPRTPQHRFLYRTVLQVARVQKEACFLYRVCRQAAHMQGRSLFVRKAEFRKRNLFIWPAIHIFAYHI